MTDHPTLTRNAVALHELAAELRHEAHADTAQHVYDQGTWGNLQGTVRVLAERYRDEDHDDYVVVQPMATCTSHACLAGTAVVLAGYRLLAHVGEVTPRPGLMEDAHVETMHCLADGVVREIRDVGREYLGLHLAEADVLFSGNWRPAEDMEVWEALDKLGAGARLRDVSHADYTEAWWGIFEYLDECPIEVR